MPTYLFVYGSLRSGFHNPAYEYLTRYFHFISEAVVHGSLYDNGAYPVAVPGSDDKLLQGELYELNDANEYDWVMAQLDDYEGLNADPGETAPYRRAVTDVSYNGQSVAAWIYWYNLDISGMASIETGDVLKYLHERNKL